MAATRSRALASDGNVMGSLHAGIAPIVFLEIEAAQARRTLSEIQFLGEDDRNVFKPFPRLGPAPEQVHA
jgi:hypothetical protein